MFATRFMYPSISYAPLFILFENILLYAQGLICAGGCTLWEIGVSFFGLNFHQQTLTLQQDKKQTCQLINTFHCAGGSRALERVEPRADSYIRDTLPFTNHPLPTNKTVTEAVADVLGCFHTP